jgi:hypothetical protein
MTKALTMSNDSVNDDAENSPDAFIPFRFVNRAFPNVTRADAGSVTREQGGRSEPWVARRWARPSPSSPLRVASTALPEPIRARNP